MINVTWEGWVDALSGIKEFDLQVRQLSGSHGNQMTEIFDSPAVYNNITESGQEITLPHVGKFNFNKKKMAGLWLKLQFQLTFHKITLNQ